MIRLLEGLWKKNHGEVGPKQGWNIAMRDTLGSNSVRQGNNSNNSKKKDWRDKCCWKFNKNRCKNHDCSYDHCCTYCGVGSTGTSIVARGKKGTAVVLVQAHPIIHRREIILQKIESSYVAMLHVCNMCYIFVYFRFSVKLPTYHINLHCLMT